MTNDEAITAVKKASRVCVHIPLCISYDGSKQRSVDLSLAKDDVIAAIKAGCDSEYEPNIEVSGDGALVIIGRGWMQQPVEDLSDPE